jgi:hypothetical protein
LKITQVVKNLKLQLDLQFLNINISNELSKKKFQKISTWGFFIKKHIQKIFSFLGELQVVLFFLNLNK